MALRGSQMQVVECGQSGDSGRSGRWWGRCFRCDRRPQPGVSVQGWLRALPHCRVCCPPILPGDPGACGAQGLHTLSPETVTPGSAVSLRPRLAQLAALLPLPEQDADHPAPGSKALLRTVDTASTSRLHFVTLLCCSLLGGTRAIPRDCRGHAAGLRVVTAHPPASGLRDIQRGPRPSRVSTPRNGGPEHPLVRAPGPQDVPPGVCGHRCPPTPLPVSCTLGAPPGLIPHGACVHPGPGLVMKTPRGFHTKALVLVELGCSPRCAGRPRAQLAFRDGLVWPRPPQGAGRVPGRRLRHCPGDAPHGAAVREPQGPRVRHQAPRVSSLRKRLSPTAESRHTRTFLVLLLCR